MGTLKSALLKLPDSAFVAPRDASTQRQALVNQYVAAFRGVESGALDHARSMLKDLTANISVSIATDQQSALKPLVDVQLAKLVWSFLHCVP